jgi:hypothetical protein
MNGFCRTNYERVPKRLSQYLSPLFRMQRFFKLTQKLLIGVCAVLVQVILGIFISTAVYGIVCQLISFW